MLLTPLIYCNKNIFSTESDICDNLPSMCNNKCNYFYALSQCYGYHKKVFAVVDSSLIIFTQQCHELLFCVLFVHQALGFVLNGVAYPSGSTVSRTDIGEGAAALQCTTDKVTCCTNQNGETRAGYFYFPDGTLVPIQGADATSPYYRTRSSMLISLNRRLSIITQPTGQFRCEIPDASGTTVNLFINVG